MSYGVVPVLRRCAGELPEIDTLWLPKLLSREYDTRFIPAADKCGVLFGMGMTERQGGSDVRQNISVARPGGQRGAGQRYAIDGHKWFFRANVRRFPGPGTSRRRPVMLPRPAVSGRLAAGNPLRLQRLKDKLGNHSNASSEVEFRGTTGFLLGEEGRGVPTIIEMATYTRLDCVLATAGMQRRALSVALHHAAQREAFGAKLIDKPIMAAVLADLAVESEAATVLAMHLAGCFEPGAPEQQQLVGRLLTPAAKFHICKRGAQFAAEAMEVLGGNGYVEETDLARIYREMPLLSIWEGAGNVMCLDVLRVAAREPDAVDALAQMIRAARGSNAQYDAYSDRLLALLKKPAEEDGRRLAHAITLAVQGALLVTSGPADVSDTFCATRLGRESGWGPSFGVLPHRTPIKAILRRAAPRA
ncbi:MAG: acyl-CoA dehydrogenase family protein [Woeseiaceae bacterium]|nr:acyl-CoA dehydrogenase family protein [Woeseiaceae bacterium]